MGTKAPCGCIWRSEFIERKFSILFPTVFVDCRCGLCKETWTERYEFDFSLPSGGGTWQKKAESMKETKGVK